MALLDNMISCHTVRTYVTIKHITLIMIRFFRTNSIVVINTRFKQFFGHTTRFIRHTTIIELLPILTITLLELSTSGIEILRLSGTRRSRDSGTPLFRHGKFISLSYLARF
jgi:hypothetical protein